jgi:hypothetical protein
MKNKTPGKPGSGGGQMFWKTPFLGVLLIVAFLSGARRLNPAVHCCSAGSASDYTNR